MARLSDTTPEAERVLLGVLRALPFEPRWRQMGVLCGTGRRLHAAGLLARRPTATPAEILRDWARQAGYEPPARLLLVEGIVIDNEDSIRVLKQVIEVLDRLGIPYALAGSWASSLLGKMRFT